MELIFAIFDIAPLSDYDFALLNLSVIGALPVIGFAKIMISASTCYDSE